MCGSMAVVGVCWGNLDGLLARPGHSKADDLQGDQNHQAEATARDLPELKEEAVGMDCDDEGIVNVSQLIAKAPSVWTQCQSGVCCVAPSVVATGRARVKC